MNTKICKRKLGDYMLFCAKLVLTLTLFQYKAKFSWDNEVISYFQ